MRGLRRLPAREPRIGDLVRQHAVRDHRVDVVAEEREVRERAARLGDDHALGVDDEPRARDVAVDQEVADTVEAVVELLDRREHAVTGDRQ